MMLRIFKDGSWSYKNDLWIGSGSIKSAHNEAVMRKLLKEVKGLNPSFNGADIRGKLLSP